MGQAESSHSLFLCQVKEALKTRGVKVKKKSLTEFFKFVIKTCPWFPEEGTIDEKCWNRVDNCLTDYYKTFGPQRVPVTAFNYWQLIQGILGITPQPPDIKNLVSEGETALKLSSWPPSGCDKRSELHSQPHPSHPGSPLSLISLGYADTEPLHPATPSAPSPEDGNGEDNPKTPDKNMECNLEPLSFPPFKPPPYGTSSNLNPPFLYPLALMPSLANLQQPPTLSGPSEISELSAEIRSIRELTQTLISISLPDTKSKDPLLAFPILRSGRSTSAKLRPPIPDRNLALSDNSTDESREDEPQTHTRKKQTREPEPSPSSRPEPGPSSRPEPGENELEPRSTRPEPTPLRARTHARRRSTSPDVYLPLSFKSIEKFKKAVHSYGPTAPFTLALIEALGDKELTPNDWFQLAKAVLSRGDFITWRSHYEEAAREYAIHYEKREETKGWTVRKFMGQGSAQSSAAQARFSAGLISQIQRAALKAWKKLPIKNHPTSSLAKLTQGPEEPFADFLSRLQATAEHLFGDTETGCDFIKQLAFENANEPCQQAIRPFRNTDLSNWVHLCANVTPAKTMGMAIGAALQSFKKDLKKTLANSSSCFNCEQPGHFAKDCPMKAPAMLQPVIPGARPCPSTVCPRCKKGYHWASECRSHTDINNLPLKPRWQGNSQRGQPQASPRTNPGATRFVQPTAPALPTIHHAATSQIYGEQQQGVQDWTSVPPPNQY
ncbi:endogenous retrovirus group K member 8 Gag polyprotein-like [Dasypus novemcinctus]|uniref:endogenous retrovirus group K member 8 Gag polyprotein-like n=1 Tax=Dasypus novemcinctus TaxID=9361 RepID=UPI00265F1C24|nr:endogenous retrovirus group K member 8 Gag polyprotein-like [Dasypus novemcinctus]